MNIHCLTHVPFEGPGQIAQWAAARGHNLTFTKWFEGQHPPDTRQVDFLVVMGGPMNVYEYRLHPWLRREKSFIGQVLDRGGPVLGVCLGAQLIADVLGAKVYQNAEKEIGWFPVRWRAVAHARGLVDSAAVQSLVFHWHGDTFDLPPGAEWLAESEGCAHQAFAFRRRVVGLQFHMEIDDQDVAGMAHHGAAELSPGRYIQSPSDLLRLPSSLADTHRLFWNLLDRMAG